MPHMQVRTSPGDTADNLRRVTDVLAAAGINIDGIGPDFEPPHIRTVVDHEQWDAALSALAAAGLEPTGREAVPLSLPNSAGSLGRALDNLVRRGFTLESVLVLASRDDINRVRVSIGVNRGVRDGWEDESEQLSREIEETLEG